MTSPSVNLSQWTIAVTSPVTAPEGQLSSAKVTTSKWERGQSKVRKPSTCLNNIGMVNLTTNNFPESY